MKRGLSLAYQPPPNKIAKTGGVGMAFSLEGHDETSDPREDAEALSLEENTESQDPDERHPYFSTSSFKCESHRALTYHLITRLALNQEVRHGMMSVGSTDVGNGKCVT